MLVEVFLESWQLECCGQPTGVGDAVSWQLLAVPADPGSPQPGDGLLIGDVQRLDSALVPEGGAASMFVRGGLQALWSGPADVLGAVSMAGHLLEDHHAHALPGGQRTEGVVRRVRLVTRRYRRSPGRGGDLLRVGDDKLRDIDRSPRWFEHPESTQGEYDWPLGVLVELEVAD
jgi:hypothetical protein